MSNDDRELLELAAKAAGEDVEWHETGSYFYRKTCNWPAEKGFFNPRHDDGEALRLAAKLGLCIDFMDGSVWRREPDHSLILEYFGGAHDPCYRLAILRAAAEIGRALP